MKKLWIITLLLIMPLLASAEIIHDTLAEGSTKTYTIDGVSHEVTLVFVSDPNSYDSTRPAETKLIVDGILTNPLSNGESETLRNGLTVKIRDVLVNAREGVTSFSIDSGVNAPAPTAQPAVVEGTLREGQYQTYRFDGVDYEITAVYISDVNAPTPNAAKLSVNGELTTAFQAGIGKTISEGGPVLMVTNVYTLSGDRYVSFKLQSTTVPYYPEYATPGSIRDTLRVGETKTYTLSGVDYELTLVFLGETVAGHRGAAKFSLNGELTDALDVSENEALSGGAVMITVHDILSNAEGGSAGFELRTGRFQTTPPQYDGLPDTMSEGETKTYTLGGRDYEVTLAYVSDLSSGTAPQAKFSVNGELTQAIREGSSGAAAGAKIVVREILVHQRNGMVAFTLYGGQSVPPTGVSPPDANKLVVGETRTFTVDGHDYEITLKSLSPPYAGDTRYIATISVNGQQAGMTQGDYTLNGLRIVINSVVYDMRNGYITFTLRGADVQPVPQVVSDRYIIVVGKYAPTDDVVTSVNIAKRLQDKGRIGSTGIAVLDEQFQQRYHTVPDDVVIFLIRGKTVHIIVGETARTELVNGAADIQQYLQQNGYSVKVVISKDVSMRLFDPSISGGPDDRTGPGSDGSADGSGTGPDGSWPRPPSVSPTACDSGCFVNERCMPIGTRIANGGAQYCSVEGQMKVQVTDGNACQNNYECVSNQCLNAQCASLEKELRETRSMLQGFMEWWRTLFG